MAEESRQELLNCQMFAGKNETFAASRAAIRAEAFGEVVELLRQAADK